MPREAGCWSWQVFYAILSVKTSFFFQKYTGAQVRKKHTRNGAKKITAQMCKIAALDSLFT